MSEATEAFRSAMDAESGGRSIKRRVHKSNDEQDNRQSIDDVFPNRMMDRSEGEGSPDDVPDVVRKAREKAGQDGKKNFGEVEDDEPEEREAPTEDDAPPEDEDDDEPEDEGEDE